MWPPTIDGRRARSPKVDGTQDALGLGDDVVVEEQHVGRAVGLERLELGPGEAAGPADVALLDDAELAVQRLLGGGEELAVGDLLGALLHDQHLVEQRLDVVVAADLADQPGAEVRAVHRGDADGHASRARPGRPARRRPSVASSTTTAASPATTSNQYQPPSTNGAQGEVELEVGRARPSSSVAESTRWERPLAIER